MIATMERKAGGAPPDSIDVEVKDLTGQQTLNLKGVKPETPVADLIGLSMAHLSLPPSVEWLLRDDRTSRLLRHDQTIGEVSRESKADLAIQPDARLG